MIKLSIRNLIRTGLLGLILSLVGGYSNYFVIEHNNGQMPVWVINNEVATSLANDDRHTPMTHASSYKVLVDIFPIYEASNEGITVQGLASAGDMLIWMGYVLEMLTLLGIVLIPIKWATKLIVRFVLCFRT